MATGIAEEASAEISIGADIGDRWARITTGSGAIVALGAAGAAAGAVGAEGLVSAGAALAGAEPVDVWGEAEPVVPAVVVGGMK